MAMFNNPRGERDGGFAIPTAPPPVPQPGVRRGTPSVIGPDMVITGNVVATADLQIEGRVDGDVQCGTLVQGVESRINGGLRADSARLAGTIEGSVAVRQLTIERAARITGDVEYEAIAIETGASIDGRLKHVSADASGRTAERVAERTAARGDEVVPFPSAGQG